MKKQLLLFLSALLPILAMADDSGSCGTNVTYTYVSSTKTLTIQGTGVISDFLYETDVPWYSYRDDIQEVVVAEGVTSIGRYAFIGCSGLTSVIIPNSVTSIGWGAFQGSGLTSITISNNVTSIGYGAFDRCTALASLTIPSSVTSVGDFAFAGLNLTSMTIDKSDCSLMFLWFGDGVNATSIENIIIGANVSSVCGEINSVLGLESILVDANNTKYDSRNDCNAVIETATNTLVAGCKNSVIPDNVVAIGKSAFWGCSGLTSIKIA